MRNERKRDSESPTQSSLESAFWTKTDSIACWTKTVSIAETSSSGFGRSMYAGLVGVVGLYTGVVGIYVAGVVGVVGLDTGVVGVYVGKIHSRSDC